MLVALAGVENHPIKEVFATGRPPPKIKNCNVLPRPVNPLDFTTTGKFAKSAKNTLPDQYVYLQ